MNTGRVLRSSTEDTPVYCFFTEHFPKLSLLKPLLQITPVNITGTGSLHYTLETTTVQPTKKVQCADVRGRKTEGWLRELENNSYGSIIKKAGRGEPKDRGNE